LADVDLLATNAGVHAKVLDTTVAGQRFPFAIYYRVELMSSGFANSSTAAEILPGLEGEFAADNCPQFRPTIDALFNDSTTQVPSATRRWEANPPS
jgi:hypothetical protein